MNDIHQEKKYTFLDEFVLNNYLVGRSHMNAIFNQIPHRPIQSISQFQQSFIKQIKAKEIELNELDYSIRVDILPVDIPKWASREEKYYFRKYKFFRERFNKTFIKKNNFLKSLLPKIQKDVLSLVHLCSVFPFVEKLISFDPESSFTSVYRELLRIELTEYEKTSSQYSSILSQILEWYDANLPKRIIEHFDYAFPITEESQLSFGSIVTSNQFPAKSEIDFLLKTIDDTLINKIIEKTPIIVEALHLKRSSQKLISQYLLKIIFCYSNYKCAPLDELSVFLPDTKYKSVSEFGLPNYMFKDDDSTSETLTIDFVNHHELLKDASEELFLSIFEPTPIDVIFRINQSIVSINKYLTNALKKKDDVLVMIPFDDTFMLFMLVLAVSNVPNFAGLVQFLNNFLQEQILTNEQSFALSMMNSTYELYQKKK